MTTAYLRFYSNTKSSHTLNLAKGFHVTRSPWAQERLRRIKLIGEWESSGGMSSRTQSNQNKHQLVGWVIDFFFKNIILHPIDMLYLKETREIFSFVKVWQNRTVTGNTSSVVLYSPVYTNNKLWAAAFPSRYSRSYRLPSFGVICPKIGTLSLKIMINDTQQYEQDVCVTSSDLHDAVSAGFTIVEDDVTFRVAVGRTGDEKRRDESIVIMPTLLSMLTV